MTGGDTEPRQPRDPKSVLITGGMGFIGSHLALKLARDYPNAKINVFDIHEERSTLEAFKPFGNIEVYYGDVRSVDLVRLIMERCECDTVIHLAAVTKCTPDATLEFTKVNTIGTHIMLELCHHLHVGKFMLISTDAVYGTLRPRSASRSRETLENAILNPTSPYAAAHAAAEMIARAYHCSYRLDCNIVRLSNVYGPRQPPEKAVANFVLSMLHGMPVAVHGTGGGKRNYLFVDDAVSALEAVMRLGEPGEVYNVPSRDSRTVRELLGDICLCLGMSSGDIQCNYVADRPFNDTRRGTSAEKIGSLGWEQRTSWEAGLKQTVNWYAQSSARHWGGEAGIRRALECHAGKQQPP